MIIQSDLDKLIQVLPTYIKEDLQNNVNKTRLIEIIIDLGRRPEGRFLYGTEYISNKIVSWQDLDYALKRLGTFSNENRAGIKQTLHRISCIKNRQGIIIGLTFRIGRCVIGSLSIIRDLLESTNSLLILGKPGIGKTTLIREISRVLSDEGEKRVVIIDTANEIAGDSDIPHIAIGRARRMQVSQSENQHHVMKEAIENHMPQVIIVDEIGTELEALAARTMAEKGVQFIGTAHGNSLESLIKNPVLSELIGGIQSVTLSDEEARRRGTQKTVLERKALPAFQVAIELNHKNFWTIYETLEDSIDNLLQGLQPKLQTRIVSNQGNIKIKYTNISFNQSSFFKPLYASKQFLNYLSQTKKFKITTKIKKDSNFLNSKDRNLKYSKQLIIYSYYLSTNKFNKISKVLTIKPLLTKTIEEADVIIVSKKYFRKNIKLQQLVKKMKKKLYLLNSNTDSQIKSILKYLIRKNIFKRQLKNNL
jgi:stage III sporulation protein SpoIIIAA